MLVWSQVFGRLSTAAANQRVSAGFSKLLSIDRRTFKRLVGSDKVATSSTMRETLVGSKSPRCASTPSSSLAPLSTGPELAVLAPRRSAARIRDIDSGIWDDSEEEDVSSQPATICSEDVPCLCCHVLTAVCLKRDWWRCVCRSMLAQGVRSLFCPAYTLLEPAAPVPLSQPAGVHQARIPRRRNGTEKRSSRCTHPSWTIAKRRSTPLA